MTEQTHISAFAVARVSRTQTARMARLLEASFAELPVFRIKFDQHVRAWRDHIVREASFAYLADPAFAAQCDARIAEQRAEPMPAWGGRS